MIISNNYFWYRVLALFLIFSVSSISGFAIGVFFNASESTMYLFACGLASFLGAFNVFEPKVVQRDYEKIKKFWKDLQL